MATSHDLSFEYIGPIRVQNTTFAAALAYVSDRLANHEQTLIAFCNARTALLAFRSQTYRTTLSQMLVLNDGLGLDIASLILTGRRFRENMNGTDFVPRLLSRLEGPYRIFLLGAASDVVPVAARQLALLLPHHEIVGYHDGYFSAEAEPGIIERINGAAVDILLIGMGNPHQEEFIVRHAGRLQCKLVVGVGALFDFTAGRFPRAPLWVRKARLEWLHRLFCEPRRLLKRYTIEPFIFLSYVVAARLCARGHGKLR